MLGDSVKKSLRRRLAEQLVEERRNLRDQEQRLARLKYEWSIAKRLRHQANTEEEREKWRVQSDAYMGEVLQQEGVVGEIQQSIERYESKLAELGHPITDR
jgi:CDP-glycerol glycerophosphotransferase (TagB/SpsB family)